MRTPQPGVTIIDNDAEVLACLAYNGMTAALATTEQKSGMPRNFVTWATEQAVYCAVHCRSHADAQDNGYVLLIIDRETHSNERAVEILQAFMSAGSHGPTYMNFETVAAGGN